MTKLTPLKKFILNHCLVADATTCNITALGFADTDLNAVADALDGTDIAIGFCFLGDPCDPKIFIKKCNVFDDPCTIFGTGCDGDNCVIDFIIHLVGKDGNCLFLRTFHKVFVGIKPTFKKFNAF